MKEYLYYDIYTASIKALVCTTTEKEEIATLSDMVTEKARFFEVVKIISGPLGKKRIIRSALGALEAEGAEEIDFDVRFYRQHYKDLSGLTDEELEVHWENYGQKERRLSTLNAYFYSQLGDAEQVEKYSSYIWFYREFYSDLKAADFNDYELAVHYFSQGRHEGRYYLPEDWFVFQGITDRLLLKRVVDVVSSVFSHQHGSLNGSIGDAAHTLVGLRAVPFECFSKDLARTSKLYLDLATEMLRVGRKSQAKNLLLCSVHYEGGGRAFELLGNIFLDDNNSEVAEELFKRSIEKREAGEWVYKNLSKLYMDAGLFRDAVRVMQKGILEKPESELIASSLPLCMDSFWHETSRRLDGLKSVPGRRAEMVEFAKGRTDELYSSWFSSFTVAGSCTDATGDVVNNCERVLIIGDFHLGQCIRYRINQKIEQLLLQGHKVETVSWTELDSTKINMPFYDVVIFYRVPAVNQVVKQIAFTKALRKIAIYEIDDQIFLPNYPGSLDSYGGNVDVELYQDLIKGMALNNAAIQLCDYSIASTHPLDQKLRGLVSTGKGYVHRNGLDKLSWFKTKKFSDKPEVTLFYGSGTLAHNDDFIDLALPAIEKLMLEFAHLKLVVMGHLALPESFKSNFRAQLKQLPKLNDVKAYSVYLSKADINLAVLHDDDINGAKSELKWFEAACFQIPSVLSSTENYRDVIRHGEDAFLAKSTDDWYEYLRLLITDESLRKGIGTKAQERVKKDYSLSSLGRGLSKFIGQVGNYDKPKIKPKICIVNVFFPPQSLGGATRVVSDNFDVLLEQYGDEFDICIFTAEAHYGEPYKVSAYSYKGIRVYKSSVLFRENMDWHPKDERMYDIFQEFLDLEKPDKVHFHCVQRLTASIVEATRDLGIPYIITAHDAWWISDHQFLVDADGTVYPEGHADSYAVKVLPDKVTLEESLARQLYLNELINQAENVLTVSESFAEIYRKNDVPHISVTKNGISSEVSWREKKTDYTDRVVCGHIGGMSAHKGYDILKEAVNKLQPKNIELLVVDHSQASDYMSVDYWGEVRVLFLGRQSQENIVELYSKIDVLFAPSIWPESFGLVTREAAACGCWVVASNLGGIGEDVVEGQNGHIVEPSLSSLIDVLGKINRNSILYKSVALIGELGSVESQVEKVVGYYREQYD